MNVFGWEWVEVPSEGLLPGMRCWYWHDGEYAFVISFEPGENHWTTEERKKWVGYMGSWRKIEKPGGPRVINALEGGPFRGFPEAVEAAQAKYRELGHQ